MLWLSTLIIAHVVPTITLPTPYLQYAGGFESNALCNSEVSTIPLGAERQED